MPVSPTIGADDVVSFTIKADGSVIPDTTEVLSIDIGSAVNAIPRAQIVIIDGSPASQEFPVSDGKTFVPGTKIEIALGYAGKENNVFEGVVVGQSFNADLDSGPTLTVDVVDNTMKMAIQRTNAVFTDSTDSEIFKKLITRSGLPAHVDATDIVHEQIVQYNATDWDLLLTRCRAIGSVVTVADGKVTVAKPDSKTAPPLQVVFGTDILALELAIDATSQRSEGSVRSQSWDPTRQTTIAAAPGAIAFTEPGNLSSTQLAQVFGIKDASQQTAASLDEAELTAWSTSALQSSRIAKLQGTLTFGGSELARIGTTIQVDGVGERFAGTAYISGVNHIVEKGSWTTTCTLGMPATWFAASDSPTAAPTLLPPLSGLHTGIVLAVTDDPADELRVQVRMPLLGDTAAKLWVRLGSSYASSNAGAMFFPEIGDEVVIGFMNDDPRDGVILASVFSKKNQMPERLRNVDTTKAIVTRKGLQLVFDDDETSLSIATPAGQSVVLNDNEETVVITDESNNTVTLSSDGIKVQSPKTIEIVAGAALRLSAAGDMTLRADGDLELEAGGDLKANGGSGAGLRTGGTCVIAGALVEIN